VSDHPIIIETFQVTKSTYFPAFNRLCKEVAQARMEANDNLVYLEPLVKYIQMLGGDFNDLIPAFKPTMHTVLLIWKNSK
jgi:dynein heavy chain